MKGKKVVGLLVLALVLFFVITQPNTSAGIVSDILTFLRDAAEAMITFVSDVFS